jgi:hypothetical protein
MIYLDMRSGKSNLIFVIIHNFFRPVCDLLPLNCWTSCTCMVLHLKELGILRKMYFHICGEIGLTYRYECEYGALENVSNTLKLKN